MPFISICIPAYERVVYLERLLKSISIQTYKDFEVIISDDSSTNNIELLVNKWENAFSILYFKNEKSLGTPANWNFAISKAKGEWVKLMHDDDWFANKKSLEIFFNHTLKNKKIIISAYNNVFENGAMQRVHIKMGWINRVLKQPMCLMAKNIIGPPSVVLLRKNIKEKYDERLKWRVDQEYYIRLLKLEKDFDYISETLVNVGISDSQVTASCFYVPEVELPEALILLQKHGIETLKNIWVYDAWWRLFRNLNITSYKQLTLFTNNVWPTEIKKMIYHINKVPKAVLKIGILSKLFMSISYLLNKIIIK